MTDWLGLTGRSALVVGAGGLGGASAVSLAAQGARVVVVDIDEDNLDVVAREAKEAGGQVTTLVSDVSTAESSRAAVEEAAQTIGTPEIFLHAVGRNDRRPVLELGDEDWQSILTLNLSTAWWLGQEVGRRMVAAGRGRMVFVSSVSGLLAHPHHAPYAATKGGINQMMRVMAREWAASRRHGERGRTRLRRDRPHPRLPRRRRPPRGPRVAGARPVASAARRRWPTR